MSSRLSAKAGLAIRKLRLAGGWTLAQLSERSGVPLSTLSKVELGQTSLSYENLLRICKGLEIDMARLIGAEADGMLGSTTTPAAPPAALGRRAVVRRGEGEVVDLPWGPGRVGAGDLIRKAFTPVMCDVEAMSVQAQGGFRYSAGEAWLSVLDGALSLHSELYAPLHLVAGEGVYFDGRAGYALVRDSEAPCKALLLLAGDSRA
ncbi:MAG: helix-turn-helix transcriptional regulator [Caulobacter sp.]|nr:helix-turn-helix transcriptional regulator [Caulobacter sp.]